MTSNLEFERDCCFPAVVLYKDGDLSVYEVQDRLTLCSKTDLKAGGHGRFARATIVDSKSNAWEMDGATKLHGVGPFWGYNIFLNQSIRVRPNICAPPKQVQLDFVQCEVIGRLRKRGCVTLKLKRYCTIIDEDEALRTVPLIEAASSVPEIINKLLAMDFPERATLKPATS